MEAKLVSFGNYLFKNYQIHVHSSDGTNTPIYLRNVSDADLRNWESENPHFEGGGVPFKAPTHYPSRYKIGEHVNVILAPEGKEEFPSFGAKVITVHFTNSKVKYDLEVNFQGGFSTRLYNVDSILVKDFNP